MFAVVVVTTVLAGMALAGMFANPRPDHPCRICIRVSVHAVLAYGYSIAKMRYPEQFISDEVRLQAWYESHATLPDSDDAPISYGAMGV